MKQRIGAQKIFSPVYNVSPLSASIACTSNGLENIRSTSLPVCVSTPVAPTAAAQYLAVILVAAGLDRLNWSSDDEIEWCRQNVTTWPRESFRTDIAVA